MPNHLFSQLKWEEQNINSKEEVFKLKDINIYTEDNYKSIDQIPTINLIDLLNKEFSKD